MAAEKAHNNQAASSASQDGRNLPRLLPGHAANRPAHQGRAACKLQRRRLQVFLINICARSLDIHQADNMEQHYSAASARTTRSRSPADAAAARPMCVCERARTARMLPGCMPWCPHASCPHAIVPAGQVRQPAPSQTASQHVHSVSQPAPSWLAAAQVPFSSVQFSYRLSVIGYWLSVISYQSACCCPHAIRFGPVFLNT